MKNLKKVCMLFIALALMGCSKDENNDNPADNAQFTAAINGGTFTDYSAKLGFYNAEKGIGENTLVISITDENNNIIRIFLNGTGGLGNGTIKKIGNVDSNNFSTNVTIRDQAAQVTYSSTSGSITITDSRANPADSGYHLISASFNVTTSTNTGTDVTMTGTLSNMEYLN
ncbi:hypothetical protein [Algibacter sp. 2305UL17-15]|uniref:hypothetical protein n=1 Tax=Algibacter sp. 2305UL17-15 TaxID=3231268 RepID=UPI003459BFE4